MSFRTSSSERTVRDAAAGVEQQGGFVVKSATSGLVYGVIPNVGLGTHRGHRVVGASERTGHFAAVHPARTGA